MASACLLTKSHLSLHCLARSRNSQRINAIAHKRRLVGVLRCAAAEQTTLQILTAAEERAALRAVESSREGSATLSIPFEAFLYSFLVSIATHCQILSSNFNNWKLNRRTTVSRSLCSLPCSHEGASTQRRTCGRG